MKTSKRIISLILALVLMLGIGSFAYAAEHPFTDVKAGIWYEKDVASAWKSGLIAGKTTTTFGPEETITLAQAVTFAARISQYTETGKVSLTNGKDVWYSTYVDYCVSKGIISAGEFDGRWNDEATRAEMVCIFYPSIDKNSYVEINTVDDNAIPDVKISDHYAKEVYAFYRAGILTGSTGNYFKPDTSILRSEVAAIISRMLYPEMRKNVTLTLAKMPAWTDEPTMDKVITIMDGCDKSCADILRHCKAKGEDFLFWYFPHDTIASGINLAVHEEAHSYFWDKSPSGNSTAYLMPDFSSKVVYHTSVFSSNEIADLIPAHLRTIRYDTYIGDYDPNLAAQAEGVYGLLNEFNAYYWGTRAAVSLYDYYVTQPLNEDMWLEFSTNCSSSYTGYAEFRYYLLTYLLYARDNHPAVYNAILANDDFRQAFTTLDEAFIQLIDDMFAGFDKACAYLNSKGYQAEVYGGGFWVNGVGYSIFLDEYEPLMEEMEKSQYVEMAQLLRP